MHILCVLKEPLLMIRPHKTLMLFFIDAPQDSVGSPRWPHYAFTARHTLALDASGFFQQVKDPVHVALRIQSLVMATDITIDIIALAVTFISHDLTQHIDMPRSQRNRGGALITSGFSSMHDLHQDLIAWPWRL